MQSNNVFLDFLHEHLLAPSVFATPWAAQGCSTRQDAAEDWRIWLSLEHALSLSNLFEDICRSAVSDPRSKYVTLTSGCIQSASRIFSLASKPAQTPAEFSPAQMCLRPEDWALLWSTVSHIFFSPHGANIMQNFNMLSLLFFYPFPRPPFLASLSEKMLAGSQQAHIYLCCAKKEDCLHSSRSGK